MEKHQTQFHHEQKRKEDLVDLEHLKSAYGQDLLRHVILISQCSHKETHTGNRVVLVESEIDLLFTIIRLIFPYND